MDPFGSKVAVVTGGARGIGRSLAIELSRRGATVIIIDRAIEEARTVVANNMQSASARAIELDVRDSEGMQRCVEDVIGDHGRIDYMINNAGIGIVGDARDISLQDWAEVIDTNLRGVVNGVTSVYRVMATQGYGHIVNISSVIGLIPAPMAIPYGTTKSAINALSFALHAEAKELGIKVSLVCLGYVDTDLWRVIRTVNLDREGFLQGLPSKKASPDDVAKYVLDRVARSHFLISFPFSVKAVNALYRLLPKLASCISPHFIKNIRDKRIT